MDEYNRGISGKTKKIFIFAFKLMLFSFIVLLVLKLSGQLNYNWWVITSPLWLPTAIFIILDTCRFINIKLEDLTF